MEVIYALAIMVALIWIGLFIVTWILNGMAASLADFIYYSVHLHDDDDSQE
jgi:hypothetical protein